MRWYFESLRDLPAGVLPCRAAIIVLVLLATACSKPLDESAAVRTGRALLDDGDADAAVQMLSEAAQTYPASASVRSELGRAQLALGDYSAAEGSLRRARALGGDVSQTLVPLTTALIAQKKADEALGLIGDVAAQPERLRFPLAVLHAEGQLRLAGNDPRQVTRAFVAAFRYASTTDTFSPTDRDHSLAAARLASMRAETRLVEDAHEHFACRTATAALATSDRQARQGADAAARRVLRVGPERELKVPSAAAAIARDGDAIEIDAGTYPGDVAIWPQSQLLLRGVNGRPHLDARGRSAADQGTWVLRGKDITVENLEFSGARAPHRNGSGIRFLGRNLTIRDCVFHDNEAGVLTWKDPESDVLIERSVFYRNGYGDGQSHNIYVGAMRSFTLRFSHSHDAHVGHAVKSRAHTTRILYNRLTDEEDGDGSYLIDLPEGGDAYIIGNELLKGPRAGNPHAISYASEEHGITTGELLVSNNSFYNRYPYASFVRNASRRPATIANNVIAGAPAMVLTGFGTEVSNYSAQSPGLKDAARLDFGLTDESQLIDQGEDLGKDFGPQAVAEFEYVHPADGQPRLRVGPIDIGAREFCGW